MNTTSVKIALLASLIALGGAAAQAKDRGHGPIFERIDANGDGAVTQEEVRAHAAARFAQADADNDGSLTAQEMLALRGGQRAERMLERHDTDGNGQLSAEELRAASEGRGEKRLQRMLNRMDANDDGKLSLAEMNAHRDPADMFKRLDADGDGSLTADEFAQMREGRKGRHKN